MSENPADRPAAPSDDAGGLREDTTLDAFAANPTEDIDGIKATPADEVSVEGEEGSDDATRQDHATSLTLPAEPILAAIVGDRRIGRLDGSSVPLWLMAEPVAFAMGWLGAHGRRCKRPALCADTPGPLRRLLKMRDAARLQHEGAVQMALWRYPDTTMVREVRERVAAHHQDVVESIKSERLFTAESLARELTDANQAVVQRLAAALWASGLETEAARELFAFLPAIAPPQVDAAADPTTAAAPPTEHPGEKGRHRARRLALQRRVAELEGELAQTRGEVRTRAAELGRTRRELEDEKAARAALATRVEALDKELEGAAADARRDSAALLDAAKKVRQASATSEAYRVELVTIRQELADLERERRASARGLAAERARVHQLQAEIRAIPRDKDAIADWLRREEDRLQQLVYTQEGRAKDRATEDKKLRRKLEQAFFDAYPDQRQARPVSIGPKRSVTFSALGGGNEVGRSAYLVSLGDHRVLVDCGIAVGARTHETQIPDLSSLSRLDALLVTHAHTDHVGWIPALVNRMPDFPIHCTERTAELLPVMLDDSRKHYERWLAKEQIKQQHNTYAPAVEEEYTRDDVTDAVLRLSEARVGEVTAVGATDLQATFFPAGHILGAASILIEGGGRRILFSGDVSSEFQRTVNAFSLPDELGEIDLLVLESTYGDRCRGALAEAQSALVRFVQETVPKGIAILPCFALGRAQEVLAILSSARQAGELPRDLVIRTDGMINKINPVYVAHSGLSESDFVPIVERLDRELAIRSATSPNPTPTVVVTTSGMLTGGPVIEWAKRLLHDPRHRMALLGYQDEGAPGGLLRKLEHERPPHRIPLTGEGDEKIEVEIASRVLDLGLSAHADQDGLVAYAKKVRAKKIVLVHGGDRAREMLRERLLHQGVSEDVELAQTVELQ